MSTWRPPPPSIRGGSPPCTTPSWRRRWPLLHQVPARRWTVAELAGHVAASRSLLDDRFRQVLGRSPIRYLTEWRMHLADELLATTELSVFTIARRVGYDSEEAFSRAFKRSVASRRAAGEPRRGVNAARYRRPDAQPLVLRGFHGHIWP